MKKILFSLSMTILMAGMFASCGNKKEAEVVVNEPPKQEVYQPKHQAGTVDLKTTKTYNYVNAPMNARATSVRVDYDPKTLYKPITIKYSYANGDSYTWTVPKEFGLWANEAGKLRVVSDNNCTVWIQGQTRGKFLEFVFYGDPANNGKKVKPNSYRNLPAGEIVYRK